MASAPSIFSATSTSSCSASIADGRKPNSSLAFCTARSTRNLEPKRTLYFLCSTLDEPAYSFLTFPVHNIGENDTYFHVCSTSCFWSILYLLFRLYRVELFG